MADSVLTVIRERYADFGPTLAWQKLRKIHGIVVSKETVRRFKSEVGYWVPRRQRPAKTQFGRAMYELNIESICANSSQAKGCVERANLTLQYRLVKALRLQGISMMNAGNAYAPCFIADFNQRFAKPPRNDFDAHRPLRSDEDLSLIFTVRETRLVSARLTLRHDKFLYLLADTTEARAQIGKDIDIIEYPDGRIAVRAHGVALAYTIFDKLPEASQAAIVESKRLGHILTIVQEVQKKRDSRRALFAPARTNIGAAPVKLKRIPGTKSAKNLNMDDLVEAIDKSPFKTETTVMKPDI